MIDEDGNGITSAFYDAGGPTVAGTDGANGAKIFNREYLRSGEYIADPNAASRVLAYIINC